MGELRLYEQVRVVRLLHPPEHYDGWRVNQRPPAVGDIGYLIDILQTPGVPDGWLGDFLADELEPVDPEAA
jgi:hypothetical protein